MKTILFSTTSLHNCGDDFIRDGLLNLINLKPKTNTIWWNRAAVIKRKFSNDLKINLSLMDYFIIAGTPKWIGKNEKIYRYCLKKRVPLSIIGVGTAGGLKNIIQKRLMEKVAASNLCEVALARDYLAKETLEKSGFQNVKLMLDTAFFNFNPQKNDSKYNKIKNENN